MALYGGSGSSGGGGGLPSSLPRFPIGGGSFGGARGGAVAYGSGGPIATASGTNFQLSASWEGLTELGILLAGILVIVLLFDKLPKIGAPFLLVTVLLMLFVASKKGVI